MLQNILDVDELKYYGKKVLMRVDFNVSLDNKGIIGEDYRIRMTIPTIEYLTRKGARLILMSHLDRPTYHDSKYTLRPVAKRLSEIIPANKVKFVDQSVGPVVQKVVDKMENGDILLLENLRFHEEEVTNDLEFSKKLASLADIYVNDAFSTSHRRHASTYGAPNLFDTKVAGLNLKKEVEYLSMIRDSPEKPFILVVGGVKIKDKIGALENLLPKADKLLVGAKTGNSLIDNEHLPWVNKALSTYRDKIMLPVDHIVSSREEDTSSVSLVKEDIPEGMTGFDIGLETAQQYSAEISGKTSGSVFWNGPMGLFEIATFANGTINTAKSMALAFWRGSKTLIGGGDTLEAMKRAGVSEAEVSHVSTGGGATLRFLAGDEMPGIDVLDK